MVWLALIGSLIAISLIADSDSTFVMATAVAWSCGIVSLIAYAIIERIRSIVWIVRDSCIFLRRARAAQDDAPAQRSVGQLFGVWRASLRSWRCKTLVCMDFAYLLRNGTRLGKPEWRQHFPP